MCGINKQKLGTGQMTSFSLPSISGLFSSLLSTLYSSDHHESTSELTMGPNEWKEVANIDVEATDVPQSLLEATDELSKTHILCCAPKNMSISKLYEIEGKDTSALSQADQEKNPKTYWFWMSRETTHKYLKFRMEEEKEITPPMKEDVNDFVQEAIKGNPDLEDFWDGIRGK